MKHKFYKLGIPVILAAFLLSACGAVDVNTNAALSENASSGMPIAETGQDQPAQPAESNQPAIESAAAKDPNSGTLESLTSGMAVIDDREYPLSANLEINGLVQTGKQVEYELMTLDDGSEVIIKIEVKSDDDGMDDDSMDNDDMDDNDMDDDSMDDDGMDDDDDNDDDNDDDADNDDDDDDDD